MNGRFLISRSTDEQFFVLKAKNGEIIGKSESYSSTAATKRGIQSVKTNAPSAVTEEDSQPE